MDKTIAILLAALMIFGCISGETRTTAPVNTIEPEPAVAQMQHINLTITRSHSGVMTTDTVFPEIPHYDFSNKTTVDGRLIVYFFYSPYCSACKAVSPDIKRLEQKYQNVSWNEYDITTQNGSKAYEDYASQMNLSAKERLVPQVLVDGRIITDRFNINSTLESVIENFSIS